MLELSRHPVGEMAPVVPDQGDSEAKSAHPDGGFARNFEAGAHESSSHGAARRKLSKFASQAAHLGLAGTVVRKFMSHREAAQHVRLTVADSNLTTQRGSLRRMVEKSATERSFKLQKNAAREAELRERPSGCQKWMIRPSRRIGWDLFLCGLVCYVAIVLPYRLGFGVGATGGMGTLELAMDFCFMADVVLNFFTITVVRGEQISDPRRVAKMYLKSWFVIDLVSSLPLSLMRDIGYKQSGMLSRMAKLLKISRILKVFRLLRMSKFFEQHADEIEMMLITSSFTSWMHLMSLFGLMMYICHVMACLWAGIARAAASGWAHGDDAHAEPYTWAYLYADGGDDDAARTRAVLERWLSQDFRGETEIVSSAYLACFYWAMTTITTVGYGDICPESDAERLYAIAAMVLGGGFYGYLVGNITAIVTSVDAAQRARAGKMEDLHAYMNVRNFPDELRTEVHRYFRRFFDEKSALDESAVLNDLSVQLRTKVGARRTFSSAPARAASADPRIPVIFRAPRARARTGRGPPARRPHRRRAHDLHNGGTGRDLPPHLRAQAVLARGGRPDHARGRGRHGHVHARDG